MKKTTKKILISFVTVIIVLSAIGFLYPLFVHTQVAIAPIQNVASENFSQKIMNDIKKVTGGETAQVNYAIIADDATTTNQTPVVADVAATSTLATPTNTSLLPVYFGVIKGDLIDPASYPDGSTIYSMIQTLTSVPSTSRAVDTVSFTAANSGYYVYFAWPTSYEKNGTYSCKSITPRGKPMGDVDCFSSGLSDSLLFNTTDLEHRTLSKFTDGNGNLISYELYRAHYFISPGTTVYYKTF